MRTIILFVIPILFFGCKTKWIEVQFENNSNDTLYYYCGLSSSKVQYPDTSISNISYLTKEIRPFSKKLIAAYVDELLPFDTVSLFIFSLDTLLNNHWNDIEKNYKVLVRYDLSRQDVIDLNYVLPYSPTELMKNMKMWPKYETVKE